MYATYTTLTGNPVASFPRTFFARDVDVVARALIGVSLTVDGVGGIIVETESYDPSDPASHSFGSKRTVRNAVMFGAPGHAYVYRIYGMHWCLNFTCGDGTAVLIRALEPTVGIGAMQKRRGVDAPKQLCSGPGKLCEALAVTGAHNGHSLFAPPFQLSRAEKRAAIVRGPRIGITKGAEAIRRYGLKGSLFVSKPFKAPDGD
ncbi:MAG: DNA-3-methyladenine glycosylase [Alphaproteobacteria bacterium]|nr:DNA-3-methyladenine glycosylase [Alphaproteobacteria bacterium]MBV9904756.1 DNA-3-methyladenine glycosylase [Alphaproteobacteria bacterium]